MQLYTALVFAGPALVGRIKSGLAGLLERDGFGSIAEAVGTAHDMASHSSAQLAERVMLEPPANSPKILLGTGGCVICVDCAESVSRTISIVIRLLRSANSVDPSRNSIDPLSNEFDPVSD